MVPGHFDVVVVHDFPEVKLDFDQLEDLLAVAIVQGDLPYDLSIGEFLPLLDALILSAVFEFVHTRFEYHTLKRGVLDWIPGVLFGGKFRIFVAGLLRPFSSSGLVLELISPLTPFTVRTAVLLGLVLHLAPLLVASIQIG